MKLSKIMVIVLSGFTINAWATTADEIDHLLNYVELSACQYERDGNLHNGTEAVRHLNKRYKYFRRAIGSTEDFIKYAATKSKRSGKFYKIYCDNEMPANSRDWLLKELRKYRKQQLPEK